MNQDQTPLIDAISDFEKKDPAFFRIPAHRFEKGVDRKALSLLGEKAWRADLTEAEGLDDLHAPEGPILEAEQLAADLYGSDRCWFLVNGTTCGNEAMILAAVPEGGKILLPRNAHKSALMGMILSGARPVWVTPDYEKDWDIYGCVDPDDVEWMLQADPEIRAVFLVSPTYYGICSDVRRIADICHNHHVPLLVDEAHGSHLYFGRDFPAGAVAAGADLVSQSIHKTAGSMTQSSMLQMKSSLIDPERVDACLKLVMSTSPNYLLMASLDGARHSLAMQGREMMERAEAMADLLRDELSAVPGVRVMMDTTRELDPLRVVFSMADAGYTGFALQKLLFETGRVSTELADFRNVVCVVTWANAAEDLMRLVNTVKELSRNRERYVGRQDEAMTAELEKSHEIRTVPSVACSPREAFYRPWKEVPWEEAAGEIAAEAVIPYPPGIPLLNPGERIMEDVYEEIDSYRRNHLPLHGPASRDLRTIRVLKG